MNKSKRLKKIYVFLVLGITFFIAFFITHVLIINSLKMGDFSLLANSWISLVKLFDQSGLNILASCLALVLIIFDVIYYVIWFRSTKSKNDRVYLSIFLVLLILISVYGIRGYQDNNIISQFVSGDYCYIIQGLLALFALIFLSLANSLVLARRVNEVAHEEVIEETQTDEVNFQEYSSNLSKPVLALPTTNKVVKQQVDIKDEISTKVLRDALNILKEENLQFKPNVPQVNNEPIYAGGYGIKPIVFLTDGGKKERVIHNQKELDDYASGR